jgi:predicted small lipoprotein YifL
MKRGLALLVIAGLLLLIGCGRKTPAVPPQAVIAEAITDLRSQQDDSAVTLTWTYPRLSINAKRIDNIRSFIIFKARIPAADACSGCPVVYDETFEVNARELEPGSQVSFRDTALEPGYAYVYMVRSNSGWRVLSTDSNRITLTRHHPLMPPLDIRVDSGDSNLTLTWSAVTSRTDGSPFTEVSYQVYRSLDSKNFQPLGLPTQDHSFIDPAVTNGRTYFYQVRAVTGSMGSMTLGSPSKIAIGMPVDMTPPAPPAGLMAVERRDGVQLHWLASPDTDVGGYHVHRQDSQGLWQRIATTKAGAITYADITELPAGLYSYRVTAFDQGPRRNESAPSQTVTYTKPQNPL